MFGIVDCNNFYASCERLFNPKLEGKPIVVLSNNDGCVIARSNEAKGLGIKMGEPFFKLKYAIKAHNINVFSSNYALYGDMSRRVMNVLIASWPEIEIYSIDEAFLNLTKLPFHKINDFCDELQKKVKQHTGIPVSIGIGQTKTLAKLANNIAKSQLKVPVFFLDKNSEWLEQVKVNDIWGVGRSWSKKLTAQNIVSAKDLQGSDSRLIRKKFSIVLERTCLELRGINCNFDEVSTTRKTIISSKSFGCMQTEEGQVVEALSSYCERACEKLRRQKSVVGHLQVFLHTNHFRNDLTQYANSIGFKLITPTDDTRKIVKCARFCLHKIFKEGCHYKKVGVILGELQAKNQQQFDLFSSESEVDAESSNKVMLLMDAINQKYGRNTLKLASNGVGKSWVMRKDYSSPCYTTQWDELPKIF